MKLTEGSLEFEFKNAINGFKFDEMDNSSSNYHGLSHCMKGVDFVIEFDDYWLFVEVKDPDHPDTTEERVNKFKEKAISGSLISDLVLKYRDTFLYHWAENKTEKQIMYVCLITLECALISKLMSDLKRQLPEGSPNTRWKRPIAQSSVIANIDTWNASFKQWSVNRVTP